MGNQAIDVVIPFTTPDLTRTAIAAAERFSTGLQAAIRLLRIHVVPYPQDMNHPGIAVPFIRAQMARFHSDVPMRTEVVLARDYDMELAGRLTFDSVIVLASHRRFCFSRTWLLARRLRRTGHRVVLVYKEKNIA